MTGQTHEEVHASKDVVNRKWVYGVFIGCIVVTILSVLWSTQILDDTQAQIGVPHTKVTQAIGPRDIGLIDQSNILHDQYGLRLEKAQAKGLDRYGWVDKRNGIARIPIDEAMKAIVEEAKR
jgi:hypothetical protein